MTTIKIADTAEAFAAAEDYAIRTGNCISAALVGGSYCPCAGCMEDGRAEAEAEWAAEQRNERWFEDRGVCYGVPNYTDPQGGSCLCC